MTFKRNLKRTLISSLLIAAAIAPSFSEATTSNSDLDMDLGSTGLMLPVAN